MAATPEDDERRRRREWIAAHHPDRGGDPATFAAGLAHFDRRGGSVGGHRPTVYRSRNPWRRLRRLVRAVGRRRTGRTRRLL